MMMMMAAIGSGGCLSTRGFVCGFLTRLACLDVLGVLGD
jgi:hypothetical protein